MEKFKMLRHLEEESEATINRDGDINTKEIDLLINFYIPSIINEVRSERYDRIVVISSDRQRSKQTAAILKNEITKHISIPIDQETDPRTSAENHGEYKEGIDEDNPLVKKAKFIYLRETFEKKNIWYRYGASTNDFDEETYPELTEIFDSPGENQIELNIRIYRFILDLLSRIKKNPETLFVLSTHYIVMSRILSLQHIAGENDSFLSLFYQPQGELYKHENEVTEKMIGGWGNFYDFFTTKNFVFDVDISKLESIQDVIQSDLDILIAKYMQHYGKEI